MAVKYKENNSTPVEEATEPAAMHPKKFVLWLIIASIVMLFAALTSAYIVRQAEGNWLEFKLPGALWATSAILLISSITMHWSVIAAKRNQITQLKTAIAITTFLGTAFLVGQWIAWTQLVDAKVFFVGNPSGSFLYVLTGLHALHLISGLIFLLIVFVRTFLNLVNAENKLSLEMCATYWHFLDGLWLYLFLFLLFNR
jgi:cytochrome c oxidase subunit 3